VTHPLRRLGEAVILYGLVTGGMLTCAAGLMPSYNCGGKERAYLTAMKSDLRNMSSAQEAFFDTHRRYASDLGEMKEYFRQSTGVTVAIVSGDAKQWRARTTHVAIEASCTFGSADLDGPRCMGEIRRPRVSPQQLALNLSLDFWLFASSFARRRRHKLERSG
jgi:hypothetical protein